MLIKGHGSHRFDRIALALTGRMVRCNINFCKGITSCVHCHMLERGWKGLKAVT